MTFRTHLLALIFVFSVCLSHAQSSNRKDICDFASIKEVDGIEVLFQSEQSPEFPGGSKALTNYINKEFKYSKKQKEWGGNLVLSFIVNTDGSIVNPCIIESSYKDPGMKEPVEQEALRVVSSMPKWNPGKNANRTVPVFYELIFFLNTNKEENDDLTYSLAYEAGRLHHGDKIGVWEYYDTPHKLSIAINYDSGRLTYLSPDSSEYSIYYNNEWIKAKLDVQPRYLGSMFEFYEILRSSILYPDNARRQNMEGTINLLFEIDTTGSVANVKVINDIGRHFGDNAINVFKHISNRWLSAQKGGLKFSARFNLPITFKLTSDEDYNSAKLQAQPDFRLYKSLDTVLVKSQPYNYYVGPRSYSFQSSLKSISPDKENQENNSINYPDTQSSDTSKALDVDFYQNNLSQVDIMPAFPGGQLALFTFLQKNIKYPPKSREGGIQGTVYATFVVDTSGNIVDADILRGISKDCDEEVLRVISLFPQWTPAKLDGKVVECKYNLPIRFTISGQLKDSPKEFAFFTDKYIPSANRTIDKIIRNDFKTNQFSDYSIGDNYFSFVFPVDKNGTPGLFEPLTEWGHQFFEPLKNEILKNISFPAEKIIVFVHLKILITKENKYQYTFQFSSKNSAK